MRSKLAQLRPASCQLRCRLAPTLSVKAKARCAATTAISDAPLQIGIVLQGGEVGVRGARIPEGEFEQVALEGGPGDAVRLVAHRRAERRHVPDEAVGARRQRAGAAERAGLRPTADFQ